MTTLEFEEVDKAECTWYARKWHCEFKRTEVTHPGSYLEWERKGTQHEEEVAAYQKNIDGFAVWDDIISSMRVKGNEITVFFKDGVSRYDVEIFM